MFLAKLLLSGAILTLHAHAALLPRADCTTTVAASTVTVSTYTDLNVAYTTNWVTVYSEPSGAAWATPSAANNAVRDLAPETHDLALPPRDLAPTAANTAACATVSTNVTTTTVTQTFTFSHAARATATAAACAAHNIFNGTVAWNTQEVPVPVGQPRSEVHAGLSPVECCNYCFRGTCMYYTFDTQCTIFWSDGGCPSGWGQTEALRYENDEGGADGKGLTGLGPCLVEVAYYIDG